MQPQHSCGTVESRNRIYSVARSKSYISLSTLWTIVPCYTGHVYAPKAFEAFQIKLRPRRFQPNSRNYYTSP